MKHKKRQNIVGTFPFPSPIRNRTVMIKGHIDLVTFRMPFAANFTPELEVVLQSFLDAKVMKVPKRGDWFPLHDPTPDRLQALLDTYPQGEILGLEVAVDFYPREVKLNPRQLDEIHGYLRHGLMPTGFPPLGNAKRKAFETRKEKVVRDRMGVTPEPKTTYWRNQRQTGELKLYVKTKDQGRPVERPRVRVELALNRGGCQEIDVRRIARLPFLFENLRVVVGSAFPIVQGAKYNPKVTRSIDPRKQTSVERYNRAERKRIERGFSNCGAAWCELHGQRSAPDALANRAVGVALQGLSRKFKKVQVRPEQREQVGAFLDKDSLIYQTVSGD